MVDEKKTILGDLLEKNVSKKSVKENELVTFIPMECVSQDGKVINNIIIPFCKVKKGLTYFEKDEILVAKITPCFENGKGACLNKMKTNKGFGSTEFHVLRANKDSIPKYIFYHTQSKSFRRKLEKEMVGSAGQKRIQLPLIINYELVTKHIKSEQKAIATALSDIDDLILYMQKLIDKKKLIKQGAMQELLTGKRRIKEFKDEWEEVCLQDIADFYNGKAHENSIIKMGKYIVVNSKYISSDGNIKKYSDEAYCLAEKNDILMVMSDVPNGKAIAKCYLVKDDNRYSVNQRVCIIKIKNGNSKYFYYRLNRNKYYLSYDDGVKQTNLRKSDILEFTLKVPTIEEQEAIATILSDMDKEIEKLEIKLDKYRQIKKGMMEELLTGKRRLI